MNRRAFLAVVGASGASLSGCVGLGGSSTPSAYDVGMGANAFRPETHETTVGEAVVWKNTSSRAHTVTAYGDRIPDGAAYFASGGFDSERAARNDVAGGLIDPGGTYDRAFEEPGRYEYFCVPHEGSGMVGTVVVE